MAFSETPIIETTISEITLIRKKQMKKISWGTGITIVIILFLIVTIRQAIAIHVFIDYDLVEEEYYDAEIKHDIVLLSGILYHFDLSE